MQIPEGHFRHILLFYFRKGKNAAQAHRKLCGVYGDECLSERQWQNWFARFSSGNFDVKDNLRPGRPIVEKVDEILKKTEVDRHTLEPPYKRPPYSGSVDGVLGCGA